MAASERTAAQIAKAEALQDALLDLWLKEAKEGTLSSTDRATITRLLSANGWVLDPAAVPQQLLSKLTSRVKFDDDIDGEAPSLRVVV